MLFVSGEIPVRQGENRTKGEDLARWSRFLVLLGLLSCFGDLLSTRRPWLSPALPNQQIEGIRNTVVNIAQEHTVTQLRKELGTSEETEQLIDWLVDSWDTLEMLRDRFGDARAIRIFTAYAPLLQEQEQEALDVGVSFTGKGGGSKQTIEQ